MFNLLPCPNSIRYSWFWSGPQRQTRGDSSLWPPGTVTKLPSGTSPGPPQNPKIQNPQNPKSKIPKIQNPQNPQNPKPKTPGFWILDFGDFGFWILDFGDFGFWILGILDFGFWILGPESQIQNPKSKIPKIQNPQNPQNPAKKAWILDFGDFGFWILGILDFGFLGFWGFWILDCGDFGFWILDFEDFGDFGFLDFWNNYVADLYVQSLDFGIWGFWILGILDFGFWGSWILDFGFWGSWILDFGLGILDGHLVTKFWMLHKKRRLCTPNRVGGFAHLNHTKKHAIVARVSTNPSVSCIIFSTCIKKSVWITLVSFRWVSVKRAFTFVSIIGRQSCLWSPDQVCRVRTLPDFDNLAPQWRSVSFT